ILPRIRRPSFSPGPRNPFSEDRLALSKEALKMYGNPASAATLAIFSAMARACDSVSMTQGPAIRKRGLPAPRRSLPSSISRVAFIGDGKKPVNYLGYAGRAGFATVLSVARVAARNAGAVLRSVMVEGGGWTSTFLYSRAL